MTPEQSKFIADMQAMLAKLPALFEVTPTPVPTPVTGFTVQGGKIFKGSQKIQLRGISHFGFNGDILRPMGLWNQEWHAQLAQIAKYFNAVRVPFVPDTLYAAKGSDSSLGVNTDLAGKTPLQTLDLWMAEADRLGLYILLDFHSVSKMSQYFHPFVTDPNNYGKGKWVETWNQQPYTTANWIRDLVFVANRYKHLSNFMGIDIFNEPHDRVRWDTGGDAQWKPLAEKAATAILAANPNLLIFVQGITANWDGKEKTIPLNWGENLQPQAYSPLNIQNNKLVLSPHTYGPDTYMKPSFSAPNYPKNLPADWETAFGQFSPKNAVVVGEWGGDSFGNSLIWQNAFVDYLISKDMRSTFYWSYYGSGDTGDILNDDLTINEGNLTLLRRLWG